MKETNPIFGDALKKMMEASSGMDINPYEDDEEPIRNDEPESVPSSSGHPAKAPKKKAAASGEGKASAHYHIACPESEMRSFRKMYLAYLVSGGKAMSFSAYMRQLITQGFKSESKDIRDEYRRLGKE